MALIVLWLWVFAIVVGVATLLADAGVRKVAVWLCVVGFVVALGKIWLFQQAPQWHDVNPDSITYDANARAFARHWAAETVDAYEYRLRGLQAFHEAGLHERFWRPADSLSYASVIGSHEWIYPAWVGLHYWLGATLSLAIYSNALFAAFLPAAAFGLALALGASSRLALAAAGLALLDPSSGVNASWMIKDTLVAFFAMIALWAAARLWRGAGWPVAGLLGVALAALGAGRFVAFLAVVLAAAIVLIFVWSKAAQVSPRILSGLALGWAGFGLLYYAPQTVTVTAPIKAQTVIITAPIKAILGGIAVLRAERGEEAADDTVLRWKEALRHDIPLAAVKSVAHTLFAPYPWVAIHPGLTWRSFSELYYPGMVLWIACLPGIFMAIGLGLRTRDPVWWMVLIFLGTCLVAYTVFQGEWSTRQRVFALPVFFAATPIGWAALAARWRSRKCGKAALAKPGAS